MNEFDILHLFTYHSPTEEKQRQYAAIRMAAREFAAVVIDNTPASADQSVAVRCIREAVMNANAAIALDGRIHKEPK
ncbi:MAG: hypothetical protein AB7I13_15860 [Vicinamibacterales bacterium]